jgi:hypothetical protein
MLSLFWATSGPCRLAFGPGVRDAAGRPRAARGALRKGSPIRAGVHENVISAPRWGGPSVRAGGQSRSFQLPGVIAGGVEDAKHNDGVAFNAVEELVGEAPGQDEEECRRLNGEGRRGENCRSPISNCRLGNGVRRVSVCDKEWHLGEKAEGRMMNAECGVLFPAAATIWSPLRVAIVARLRLEMRVRTAGLKSAG